MYLLHKSTISFDENKSTKFFDEKKLKGIVINFKANNRVDNNPATNNYKPKK